MKLIALYSPVMGSGKTTAAKYLEEQHSFKRLSFAQPLKQMLEELLRICGMDPAEYLYGKKKEEVIPGLGVTPRRLMQTLGTEWGREQIDPDFWVKIMRAIIESSKAQRIVIDDMRFPNEYDMVKALGGLPVLLMRPGVQATGDHASENALKDKPFECGVHNWGSLQDLYANLDRVVERVVGTPPAAQYY